MADLLTAVQSGDYRRSLEELRDTLAESMSEASADKRAPLAKQLVEVLQKLESLPTEGEKSRVDELANRREARRSVSPRSEGLVERGPGGG